MATANKSILFVSHSATLQGGGESSLLELMKDTKKQGYKVYAVSPGEGDFAKQAIASGIDCLTLEYTRWWSAENDSQKLANLAAIERIAALAQEKNIGCIASNTLTIPWGALAAAAADVPHIWMVREFLSHQREGLQSHYDFVGAYSNVVIANSKCNADFIKSTAGIPAEQFYSFVDITNLKLAETAGQSPKLVSIGIVHPDKNQLEVLEALAELKRQKFQQLPRVLFFGAYREDDYYHQLKDFVARHGLDHLVTFCGFTIQPYNQITADDILIQPSKQESLGRTITEAMKLGLICLGADIPGTREAFQLGGGHSYKSGDSKQLAKLIGDALTEHASYKAKAEQAAERALKNLSREACNEPFFKAVEKVRAQPNPRRELRHLRPQLNGMVRLDRQVRRWQTLAEESGTHADRYRKELEAIRSSTAYRAFAAARRVKNIPRRIATRRGLRPIHFIYLDKKEFYGSTVMRGQQLSDIARQHLPERQIDYRPLNFDFHNSTLFITKWALAGLKTETIAKLKRQNNILIFDPVDAALQDFTKDYADIVVAASKTALADYQKQLGPEQVRLVNHHVDPRIKFDVTRQPKNFKAAYFGELVNTFSTPAIQERVDFVQVDTNKQVNNWLDELNNYSFHYAIRQIKQMDNHKPFLKGFTAAHCHSNMLIQDSQPEALMWLGKDYPYLIKGQVTEKKVIEKLDHIKDSFGSAEWKRAMSVMESIRQETSEDAIAREFKAMIEAAENQ